MKPTSDVFGKIIDRRRLYLSGNFFNLTTKQMTDLAKEFYSFVSDSFGDTCVFDWKYNEKPLRNLDSISIENNLGYVSLLFEGDRKSTAIYNKTTLRKYTRRIQYDPVLYRINSSSFYSADYPEYRRAVIDPAGNSPALLRDALYQVFSEEGRIDLGLYLGHDLSGLFYCDYKAHEEENVCGSMYLRFSCYFLDEELDETANLLLSFSKQLSLNYNKINITIGIGSGNEFKAYYPSLKGISKQDDQYDMLWENANILYLQNVGWANIISPRIAKRILPFSDALITTDATECIMENGALCVLVPERIHDLSLSSLKAVKRRLYPVLFPGEGSFPIDYPYFRSCWEMIPVLDQEIEVFTHKVYFRHISDADRDYLLEKSIEVRIRQAGTG